MSVKKLKMDDVYYRMKLKFENKSCIIVMSIIDKSDIKLLKSKCKDESSTQSQNNTKDIKQYIYNGLAFLDSQSSHSNKYVNQMFLKLQCPTFFNIIHLFIKCHYESAPIPSRLSKYVQISNFEFANVIFPTFMPTTKE